MAASLQSHIKLRPSPATIYATDMGALFPYVHLIMASCAMFSTRSDFLTRRDICSFICFKSPVTVCSSLMTTFIVLCKAWLLVMNSSVLLYFLYGGKTFIVSSSVKDNFSRYSILGWIFFFIVVWMDHFVEKSIRFVKKSLYATIWFLLFCWQTCLFDVDILQLERFLT